MSAKWIFKELQRGLKDRQPTQGEFFATDAIRSVVEALVRESIQNSLDARLKLRLEPVRVRFKLGIGKDALDPNTAFKYFGDGWDHFTAKGNGLDDIPKKSEACSFLVVEDFGTTGLTGDIQQERPLQDVKNPFYYFFRTEGRSGKGEEDRGRWGIGKYVFPRSSRINACLTLTVRSDDSQRLLMGQAILKSHPVDAKYYTPDGDYGCEDNGLVIPTNDTDFINQFCKDFSITRKSETGLSVVVPWIGEDFTKDEILRAVVEDYFFPILCGELLVTVTAGDDSFEITKDSLSLACAQLGEKGGGEMLPFIELATWARDQDESTTVRLNPADSHRPTWTPSLILQDQLLELRERFRARERLAIEIPLTVRKKNEEQKQTFFKIFLANNGAEDGRPIFIRDGIIISDVHRRRVAGVCSLVVINDPPLATLLGDSENPAHTQWQKDREHFSSKYTYGKSYIDFVTQSVSMFVRYLNESDEKPDKDLLRDIFSLPKKSDPSEPKEKSKPRRRNVGEVVKPDPKIEPRKRRFTLSKIAGGFVITRGDINAETPASLEVAVAYDRLNGNPLKKYNAADFKLEDAQFNPYIEGASVHERNLNRMGIKVNEAEFKISVTGFDENRDLYVNVKAVEAKDDPEA